jgi:hypothetical protein
MPDNLLPFHNNLLPFLDPPPGAFTQSIYKYDDSPTPEQQERDLRAGKRDYQSFKNLERDMEANLAEPEPMQNVGAGIHSIADRTLVPVEGNPFHVKMDPVEYQPDFADSLQGNFGTASQQLLAQEAQRRGVVSNVMQHFTLPGRVAQGVQPETPGMMTEADAFRLNQLQNEAQNWAPAQAVNMLKVGMPMAEQGTLGVGGGGVKVSAGAAHFKTTPVEGNPYSAQQ